MERRIIVEQMRRKRKVVILTFALLLIAFLENSYLNCFRTYSPAGCYLGLIYAVLAMILLAAYFCFRK
jgi:hypothetical protein